MAPNIVDTSDAPTALLGGDEIAAAAEVAERALMLGWVAVAGLAWLLVGGPTLRDVVRYVVWLARGKPDRATATQRILAAVEASQRQLSTDMIAALSPRLQQIEQRLVEQATVQHRQQREIEDAHETAIRAEEMSGNQASALARVPTAGRM